jgi:hypothetical protein
MLKITDRLLFVAFNLNRKLAICLRDRSISILDRIEAIKQYELYSASSTWQAYSPRARVALKHFDTPSAPPSIETPKFRTTLSLSLYFIIALDCI